MPQAAKLPVQNVAEYYNLCYGLGASKGQLELGKGGMCCQLPPLATPKDRETLKQNNSKKVREGEKDVLLAKHEGASASLATVVGCL